MNQFKFINEIDLYRAYKKTKFELFNDDFESDEIIEND